MKNNNKFLKMGQAAQRMNISTSTLRGYANRGEIEYSLTPKGQRVFHIDDIDVFMGVKKNDVYAFYTRSSKGSASAHENQREQLTNEYGDTQFVYKDNGSGLNENRRGLNKLIEDAKNGLFTIVCVTHSDRLTRFGFSYVEKLLQEYGVSVKVLHEENKTMEDELMQDFMNLIASFSGKFYRMRSKENQNKLLDEAKGVLNNGNDNAEGAYSA